MYIDSSNYLYIIPEPYSPEDYQELEDEIVGYDAIITWSNFPEDYDGAYTGIKISEEITHPTFTITIDSSWEG